MAYQIRRARRAVELDGDWEGAPWQDAQTLAVDRFHPRSTNHRPTTKARVLHDVDHIYVFFRVRDRWVRSVNTDYQGPVCQDSCVEFFVQPRANNGYFNFEINCGGALHVFYVEDPRRLNGGFEKATPVPESIGRSVRIHHSLPAVVSPEIEEPVTWTIQYAVPLRFFEHFVGELGDLSGQHWRANFYKCADRTSHPHWAAWSPVEVLDFHQPERFAPIQFE